MKSSFTTPGAGEALHQAENRALGKALRRLLKSQPQPRVSNGAAAASPLQILDLACGTCREAGTLLDAFQESAGSAKGARFVGADIRGRELGEAAARARAESRENVVFEFLQENCAQLGQHKQLGHDFDVAFLRHQNYWNDTAIWQRIFDQALARLKDDGVLVITSYFDKEHALALEALGRAGAQLLCTERNRESRLLDTPGKSVDRHIALFRKSSASELPR